MQLFWCSIDITFHSVRHAVRIQLHLMRIFTQSVTCVYVLVSKDLLKLLRPILS